MHRVCRPMCRVKILQAISGGGSLKILRGTGTKNLRVNGGYPLKNSSVLTHLFTAYGQCCYFSWFFLPFLYFFLLFSSSSEFKGRCPPLKIVGGDTSPCFCHLCKLQATTVINDWLCETEYIIYPQKNLKSKILAYSSFALVNCVR